ncbi:Cytochrome P450 CYP2 subfamily [Handroanthus impetiginosus]|uniref:Cytochrome P450 CYP2 subfamily n=1 Tax=Handroanthus impetiginosus TaxID=429701 RepID=A0A2G9GVR9_9LAMI|nr:Cytochrome P450 CYP2 subfamily [Handroanthus impetiginosus]
MEPYFWLALLIPFFTIFYQTAWKNLNHNQNPKFSWPFIGFLPQMGSLAHRKLASMATSFKSTRLMFISLGSMRLVVSSHPETAKQILSGNAFSDRPIKETTRLLMFDRAIGFAPSGKYWHHLRKIASNHMFSPKRILNMEGFRQGVVNNMMQEVCKEMKERGLVELRGILHKGSLDNMLESVFGSSNFGCRGDELGLMVKEGYELIGEFNWVDYFTLGFLDLFGVKKRCYNLACKEMVFRGVDNVAILLEWIMARMVLHQDIQAKAQQEIDMCVGPNRHVQDSDIANLQYLQAIVKEVLRLHPPGPLLSWARLAIHDVHLDKCFIPAGTTAMVNMWAIAHDPMIWPDPSTFKPERFMEAEFSIMGSDLRLAPFGSGRRACPGKALGLATVHKWLARMLQQFKWLPSQPIDLGECLKLSLEMKKPLQCYAIARSFKK